VRLIYTSGSSLLLAGWRMGNMLEGQDRWMVGVKEEFQEED
jgi:hypothetical protein